MSRKRKYSQKDVCDGFGSLAFGGIEDAVSLIFMDEGEALGKLPSLNLYNVSEIKKAKGGGVEIKFFDRIKALEKLSEMLVNEKGDSSLSFFEALEKGARSNNKLSLVSDYD